LIGEKKMLNLVSFRHNPHLVEDRVWIEIQVVDMDHHQRLAADIGVVVSQTADLLAT
jgi:hypothetical protein